MERSERRRRLRSLEKLQGEMAARGLPQVTSIEHLAALTGNLASILGKKNDDQRASRAARFLHEVSNRSVSRDPATSRLHCKKGCAYCCQNYVSATIPQVLAVADFVRRHATDLERDLERIRATDARTRGLSVDERSSGRQPCALLVDNVCTVYADRPLVCRAYVSIDLTACELSFAGGPDNIPIPKSYMDMRGACEQSLWAALYGHGLDNSSYELNHAVRVALEQPDAERRWLAGEPLFSSVRKDDSLAHLPREQREVFWKVLLALSRGDDPPVSSWHEPGG